MGFAVPSPTTRPGFPRRRRGIARRDSITGCAAHIEAQDRAEKIVAVLSVTLGIAPAAAVPDPHVEVAVGTEDNVPPIVVVVRLAHREADDTVRIGAVGVGGYLV